MRRLAPAGSGRGSSPLLQQLRTDRAGAPLRVGLFEQSDRIGGRLWSVPPPGMPHVRAELGGMRFKNDQPLLVNLVRQLNLEVIPFPSGNENNLYYLRGYRFRRSQEPKAVPYFLPEQFRGVDPDDIVLTAIRQFVPEAGKLGLEGWDEVRRQGTYDGVPLFALGFWYLMNQALDQEAYAYVRDAAGYSDFTASVNAAELMSQWAIDFASNPTYSTLRDGFQALPLTLASGAEAAGAAMLSRLPAAHDDPGAGARGGPSCLRIGVRRGFAGNPHSHPGAPRRPGHAAPRHRVARRR